MNPTSQLSLVRAATTAGERTFGLTAGIGVGAIDELHFENQGALLAAADRAACGANSLRRGA